MSNDPTDSKKNSKAEDDAADMTAAHKSIIEAGRSGYLSIAEIKQEIREVKQEVAEIKASRQRVTDGTQAQLDPARVEALKKRSLKLQDEIKKTMPTPQETKWFEELYAETMQKIQMANALKEGEQSVSANENIEHGEGV